MSGHQEAEDREAWKKKEEETLETNPVLLPSPPGSRRRRE